MVERLIRSLVLWELRSTFRRIGWAGAPPDLPPDRPVVIYANHHNCFDGHFMWLLTHRLLERPAILWMDEWDRFPFYSPLGAHPFPLDDAPRRAATIRRTVRTLRQAPRYVLTYFPEGQLSPPEGGVQPFDDGLLRRLDGLLPNPVWWPVAIHVTWWTEARPTAVLTGGNPHEAPSGDEQTRLQTLTDRLRETASGSVDVLLDGGQSRAEIWNFSFARRFFYRYLSPP